MGIEGLNDDEAFEEIVRTVFSEPGAEFEDEDSIDSVVQRIYLMTRRKLGILDPLVKDEDISEIMVNGKDKIFYEKYGKVSEYGLGFETTEDLEEVMRNIAGSVHREINELNPIVDARLEDGSRVNGVYKNVALNGPILTIRKFSDRFLTMDDLVKNGTMTEKESAFSGLSCRLRIQSFYFRRHLVRKDHSSECLVHGCASGRKGHSHRGFHGTQTEPYKQHSSYGMQKCKFERQGSGDNGRSDKDEPQNEAGQDHRRRGKGRRSG